MEAWCYREPGRNCRKVTPCVGSYGSLVSQAAIHELMDSLAMQRFLWEPCVTGCLARTLRHLATQRVPWELHVAVSLAGTVNSLSLHSSLCQPRVTGSLARIAEKSCCAFVPMGASRYEEPCRNCWTVCPRVGSYGSFVSHGAWSNLGPTLTRYAEPLRIITHCARCDGLDLVAGESGR